MKNEIIELAGLNISVPTLYNTKIYAVTKSVNDPDTYTYTITHKETGVKVIAMANKIFAIQLCNELNGKLPRPFNYKDAVKRYMLDFMYAHNLQYFHIRTYNY